MVQLRQGNDFHDGVHDALGDAGEEAPLEVEEDAMADFGGQPMRQLTLSEFKTNHWTLTKSTLSFDGFVLDGGHLGLVDASSVTDDGQLRYNHQ